MTEHELKVWPEFFQALWRSHKTFEIRKNDRGYKVGDTLHLRECFDGKYSGRSILRTVTYVLENADSFGLAPGYCVLGLDHSTDAVAAEREACAAICDKAEAGADAAGKDLDLPGETRERFAVISGAAMGLARSIRKRGQA